MTVIAGYLGAGKTTLINRLLAEDHGLRLLVMVNDFGAINIDASLLQSRDEDTIALSNGCVCCTMGADLFMAIGDVLDRRPRPDHLIIEASGVSDPARIANAALAEPDLSYAGIVTVVDGPAFDGLRHDPQIGPQVCQQVACADLVWVSKEPGPRHLADVREVTGAPILHDGSAVALLRLVADVDRNARDGEAAVHPDYVSWSGDGSISTDQRTLRSALANRPDGVFRFKGCVRDGSGAFWQVQVVGQQVSVTPSPPVARPSVVAIGLASGMTRDAIETWWRSILVG